jgi:hypothetical protein
MASVYAFRPREYDPPTFVAHDADELYDRVGEYIGAGQCDGCGCATYRLGAHMGWDWIATCAVDPTDEYQHPAPCGTVYKLRLYDESEVQF